MLSLHHILKAIRFNLFPSSSRALRSSLRFSIIFPIQSSRLKVNTSTTTITYIRRSVSSYTSFTTSVSPSMSSLASVADFSAFMEQAKKSIAAKQYAEAADMYSRCIGILLFVFLFYPFIVVICCTLLYWSALYYPF